MEKKNRIRTALLLCLALALAVLSVSCEVSSSSPKIVTARLSSGEDKRAITSSSEYTNLVEFVRSGPDLYYKATYLGNHSKPYGQTVEYKRHDGSDLHFLQGKWQFDIWLVKPDSDNPDYATEEELEVLGTAYGTTTVELTLANSSIVVPVTFRGTGWAYLSYAATQDLTLVKAECTRFMGTSTGEINAFTYTDDGNGMRLWSFDEGNVIEKNGATYLALELEAGPYVFTLHMTRGAEAISFVENIVFMVQGNSTTIIKGLYENGIHSCSKNVCDHTEVKEGCIENGIHYYINKQGAYAAYDTIGDDQAQNAAISMGTYCFRRSDGFYQVVVSDNILLAPEETEAVLRNGKIGYQNAYRHCNDEDAEGTYGFKIFYNYDLYHASYKEDYDVLATRDPYTLQGRATNAFINHNGLYESILDDDTNDETMAHAARNGAKVYIHFINEKSYAYDTSTQLVIGIIIKAISWDDLPQDMRDYYTATRLYDEESWNQAANQEALDVCPNGTDGRNRGIFINTEWSYVNVKASTFNMAMTLSTEDNRSINVAEAERTYTDNGGNTVVSPTRLFFVNNQNYIFYSDTENTRVYLTNIDDDTINENRKEQALEYNETQTSISNMKYYYDRVDNTYKEAVSIELSYKAAGTLYSSGIKWYLNGYNIYHVVKDSFIAMDKLETANIYKATVQDGKTLLVNYVLGTISGYAKWAWQVGSIIETVKTTDPIQNALIDRDAWDMADRDDCKQVSDRTPGNFINTDRVYVATKLYTDAPTDAGTGLNFNRYPEKMANASKLITNGNNTWTTPYFINHDRNYIVHDTVTDADLKASNIAKARTNGAAAGKSVFFGEGEYNTSTYAVAKTGIYAVDSDISAAYVAAYLGAGETATYTKVDGTTATIRRSDYALPEGVRFNECYELEADCWVLDQADVAAMGFHYWIVEGLYCSVESTADTLTQIAAILAGKKTFRTFGGVTADTGYEGYYVTFSN